VTEKNYLITSVVYEFRAGEYKNSENKPILNDFEVISLFVIIHIVVQNLKKSNESNEVGRKFGTCRLAETSQSLSIESGEKQFFGTIVKNYLFISQKTFTHT